MLLGADEVPARIAHHELSFMRESETGVTAFTPGKVECLVGK
ncbi:MAG: hypothetical protein WAU82_10380 [Candidatus Binatus sp.]